MLVILILTFSALIQGAVGFGSALFAAPLLVLINTQYIPGPLLCAMLLLNTLIILRERSAIEFSGLGISIIGLVIGTIPAVLLINRISSITFSLIFGCLILIAVIISLFGAKIKPTHFSLFFAGCIAGFMNTISTISGPPMALVVQQEKGAKIRGMLAGFFLFANLISLAGLIITKNFSWQNFILFLPMIPGIIAGFLLSSIVTPLFDRGNTRLFVLLVAGISAIVVILKQI